MKAPIEEKSMSVESMSAEVGNPRNKSPGVRLKDGKGFFAVWAPGVQEVRVRGSFADGAEWPMQQVAPGVWRAEVKGVQAGDTYEYVLVMREGTTVVRQDPRGLLWLESDHCDGLMTTELDWISSGGSDQPGNLETETELLQRINETVSPRSPNRLVIAHSGGDPADQLNSDPDRPSASGQAQSMEFGARTDLQYGQQMNEVLAPDAEGERNLDLIMDALSRRSSDDAFKGLIPFDTRPVDGVPDSRRFRLGAALALTTAGIPWLQVAPEFLKKIAPAPTGEAAVQPADGDPDALVRKLLQLRLNLEGKTLGLCGSHTRVIHKNDDGKVIAWVRWYDNERRDGVLVIVNFSASAWRDYTIGLPSDSNWFLQAYIGGTTEAAASLQFSDEDHFPEPASLAFHLEPCSVLILSRAS